MCTQTQFPTADALVEILASPRQRFVLSYLHDNDGEATLVELSRQLAIQEADSLAAVDREMIQDAHIFLKQVHIPTLEDRGFVRYDNRENVLYLQEDRLNHGSIRPVTSENRRQLGLYAFVGVGLSGIVFAYILHPTPFSRAILSHSLLITMILLLGVTGWRYYVTTTESE
jgi:hypothetical protein